MIDDRIDQMPNKPKEWKRYKKNGEPTVQFRRLFAAYLEKCPILQRKMIEGSGLNPWDKYALLSRPTRALFFRVQQFTYCEKHGVVTLTLAGYTHAGEPVCIVRPVSTEAVIPYPYSDDFPPPPELVEFEERVRKMMVGDGSSGGSSSTALYEVDDSVDEEDEDEEPSDEEIQEMAEKVRKYQSLGSNDPLERIDDRRGKDSGH